MKTNVYKQEVIGYRQFLFKIKTTVMLICIVLFYGITGLSVEAAIKDEWESVESSCVPEIVAYGKSKFVGITVDGYGVFSVDGYDWEKGQNLGYGIEQVVCCGDYFFAIGKNSGKYISSDGINWKRIKIEASDSQIKNIFYHAGKYYTFINEELQGGAGSFGGNVSHIYWSEDGVLWEHKRTDVGTAYGKTAIGKNIHVTIGKLAMEKQYKGIYSWDGFKCQYEQQLIQSNQYNLLDVAYGSQGFVVVGENGNVWSSEDGKNWRKENINSNYTFRKIIYANYHYITFSNNGEIYVKNTTGSSSEWKCFQLEKGIRDLTYGDGKIVVCVGNSQLLINEVGSSADAYLANVVIKDGELTERFEESKLSYQIEIPETCKEIDISATLMENGGRIFLQIPNMEDKEVLSGQDIQVPLEDDTTTFKLKVIAENGVTYKTYTFHITRKEKYLIEAEEAEGGLVYGGGYGQKGEVISLTAEPFEGYRFCGWMEDGILYSNDLSIVVEVTDINRTFTPVFELIHSDEINLWIESDEICTGNTYELKALDNNGEEYDCSYEVIDKVVSYIYQGFSDKKYYLYVDPYEKRDALYVRVTLNADETIQSVYKLPIVKQITTYQVEAECTPVEGGIVEGAGDVEEGQNICIKAIENEGYRFEHWSLYGDIYSTQKELIIDNIYEDYRLEAVFVAAALDSLEIVNRPEKILYYEGDKFEPEGMIVKAHYSDGIGIVVDDYSYDTEKILSADDTQIVISYSAGGINKEVTVPIEVIKKEQTEEGTQPPTDDNQTEEGTQPPTDDNQTEEGTKPPTENIQPGEQPKLPAENKQPEEEKNTQTENKQPEEQPQSPTDDNQKKEENSKKNKVYKKNQKINKGNFTYQITKIKKKSGTVSVIKAKSNIKNAVIPNQIKIDGYTFKVTQIAKKAFYKQKRLSKVTIGKNVTSIGEYAFAKCGKLKKIDIKSSEIKKVGKKAFNGIHKNNRVTIPKKCKKKYSPWIKKNKLNIR